MKNKPIIIINGEPNSIFLEIFFKTLKSRKFKSPLILISSLKLLNLQMKKFKFKKRIKLININNFDYYRLDNSCINLIDIRFNQKKAFDKISGKSNLFIRNSFDAALNILSTGKTNKLINGPVSKKSFLDKKYLGITEYLAKKCSSERVAMLIYNKNLSVCPVTTHLPLKKVSKMITKKRICEKIFLIDNFYKTFKGFKPKIAVLGLNPHCESIDNYNEDEMIIKPAIKHLVKSGYKVSGPHSADTIFLKNNRDKFNVIVGMYHDQVLAPLKTLYEYDAINITLGLPFIRISPDHGPNVSMLGRNTSSPLSLIRAISFLDNN